MEIWPALDMFEGQVVRLWQGDYGRQVCYADDAWEFLYRHFGMLPPRLHLVDLAGAKSGHFTLGPLVQSLAIQGVRLEVGGGIRSLDEVAQLVDFGVERIVLGTQIVTDCAFREKVLDAFAPHLVAGLDVWQNHVRIKGWQDEGPHALALWRTLYKSGWMRANITDIRGDGTLQGIDEEFWRAWASEPGDLAAGGGIRSLSDIHALSGWGMGRVVVGKAVMEGNIPLEEVLKKSC